MGRRTSPSRIDVAKRRADALELRRAGCTYQEIADRLGYRSRAAACQDVRRALDQLACEPARELLTLELSRLDALTRSLWRQAREGHLGATDRLLKIMERRARYLGLDHADRGEDVAEVDRWLDVIDGTDDQNGEP